MCCRLQLMCPMFSMLWRLKSWAIFRFWKHSRIFSVWIRSHSTHKRQKEKEKKWKKEKVFRERERERKGKRKLLCNLSFEKKCKRYSYWVSYPTDILGYRIYCCVYLYARIERWETILCRPFQIQRKHVHWPMGHFSFSFFSFLFWIIGF